jgi:hypothetical protein
MRYSFLQTGHLAVCCVHIYRETRVWSPRCHLGRMIREWLKVRMDESPFSLPLTWRERAGAAVSSSWSCLALTPAVVSSLLFLG